MILLRFVVTTTATMIYYDSTLLLHFPSIKVSDIILAILAVIRSTTSYTSGS
jgi:hypothetical protein